MNISLNPISPRFLSEMVVEAIMSDACLRSINLYFETSCVYDYFYEMKVDDAPILDYLANLYQTSAIKDFLIHSHSYVRQHESEIRTQMK